MQALATGGQQGYLRIATEEAFITPQVLDGYRRLVAQGYDDPGFESLWGFYSTSDADRPTFIRDGLLDMGAQRIAHMDAAGIDRAIIALTAPGTHVFDRDEAVALTIDANDQLAQACLAHPDRFVGMTAIAPQDPAFCAREIERGAAMGMKAVILNGHVRDEYTDDPKFWPIFEAAEALDQPIYLHPQGPSRHLIQPFLERGLDGAIFGFGVDTGLHLLRLIVMGVFDRFPKLKLVVGHGGEALPYWAFRLDYMHAAGIRSQRYPILQPLKLTISEYLRRNIYVTFSGMPWEPAVKFCRDTLGADRIMYAMDYPYQYQPQEVAAMDALALEPAEKKAFFQGNAEHVFNL
ncbi:amidohydrolase family protein [Sphingobium sp. SA2]|uniref:amidohydrolase family protein n=1 Tax=Sphingobium sp. SA2 TaxID=1524832 RepID=UPI0028C0CBC4|nr:amidohydrolase family protein [Sphingobium sp. SA2]MDT7533131.1 amidohydrolase family protein [Sphingobium sp. SA2]